jgi:hypothetical protein
VREQQYVGIDLHRRRPVIVRMNDAGEVLNASKIANDPVALSMAVAEAGPDPEVVLEACYGWVRHEALGRREALVRREARGIEGGARPSRRTVAAVR